MSTYYLELGLRATGDLEQLEMRLDRVLEELVRAGDVSDADWSAALATGRAHITGHLEAEGLRDAYERFDAAISAALDTASRHTPGLELTPRSIGVTEQDVLVAA